MKSFSRQVSMSEELLEMSRNMTHGCTNCSTKAGQVHLNWFLYPTSKLTVFDEAFRGKVVVEIVFIIC